MNFTVRTMLYFLPANLKKKINYISDSFREKVPRYKWPQEIKLVNKIEKTASGKVDLRKLDITIFKLGEKTLNSLQ